LQLKLFGFAGDLLHQLSLELHEGTLCLAIQTLSSENLLNCTLEHKLQSHVTPFLLLKDAGSKLSEGKGNEVFLYLAIELVKHVLGASVCR
jgi:uncharacterized protein YaaW (UPF0174 family)